MKEILIFGEIGWENTAKAVIEQLSTFDGADVVVRINSPGGDVYEGFAIMNALRGYPGHVTAVIEGLAASAASFVAVGGADRVVARPNAELMVHEAWTFVDGNAGDLEKVTADLNRLSSNLAGIYAEKAAANGAEASPDQWRDVMRDETWFSAAEALAAGLVDEVEDARQPVAAAVRAPVFAKALTRFKYQGRSSAPPPKVTGSRSESAVDTTTKPNSGQEGDSVSILNQLAQEMGKKPEEVQRVLSGFFNEAVQITGEVEVTYPSDVKIVPTERIKVEPILGDKPAETPEGEDPAVTPVENAAEPAGDSAAVQLAKSAGLTFEMGDVADGFEATVDEGGVVTIKAPAGAEPGTTAEFTVNVNGTSVPLSVAVRSLSDDEDTTDGAGEVAPGADPAAPGPDVVQVPVAFYKELTQAYALNGSRMEEIAERDRAAEVDGWIKRGKFSAAHRTKVIAEHKKNPEQVRTIWGALPDGSVPRNEIGSGHGDESGVEASQKSNLQAKAEKSGFLIRPKL